MKQIKMLSLMLSVLMCAPFLVATVQASENVIFDEQFTDPILSPDWVKSPGGGSYSLSDNPGYLRYIIDANHVSATGDGDWSKALWLVRPFSGDQWILKTVIFYNMRPGAPTNNRETALTISAPGEGVSGKGVVIFRWVGVNDNNPVSNAMLFGSWDNWFYFPNSPNPLPIERWYFEIERNKDEFVFRASNDGNDATFEYEHEFTITPGTLGNSQELGIYGGGWYGSNTPPGYVDFDYIKVTPVNLISNPGFENGTTSWGFYTNGVGTFTTPSQGYEGSNAAAKLALSSGGSNIQLYQTGVTLEANTRYRLSFAAYSNTGHDMTVRLFKHGAPYTPYMPDFTVNLGTNWQTFKTEFNTSGYFSGMVNDGRFMFWLSPFAGAGDNYYIDAIILEKFSPPTGTIEARLAALETKVTTLETENTALKNILAGVSRNGSDIYIDGANLNIRDGSGDTAGPVNGLGNLIIGYNELRGSGMDNRTGSHNLIVGSQNNYPSFGGFVAGISNTISGEYASVSGGYNNTASKESSSVSGGISNRASSNYSSVSGGGYNTVIDAKVSNFFDPQPRFTSSAASISGGSHNIASGVFSSVSGGSSNIADGGSTSVSGGQNNRASGWFSASGNPMGGGASVSGGYGNTAHGWHSSVSGGEHNVASGEGSSSVSGGNDNEASGYMSSVSGGLSNIASGEYSSVSGGEGNRIYASGERSSISGGYQRNATGIYDWVAGALFQDQ